jgi:hypothetical protein
MRDNERFLNVAKKSDSGTGSGVADIQRRSLADGWCGDWPTRYYLNPATAVSSRAQSVRHLDPDWGFSGSVEIL